MNMAFQGSFATMPPPAGHEEIRHDNNPPLCLIAENDLVELSRSGHYPRQEKSCPYEKSSHRPEIRNILHQLQAISPQLRGHLWNSMTHIQEEYLPRPLPSPQRERKQLRPHLKFLHTSLYTFIIPFKPCKEYTLYCCSSYRNIFMTFAWYGHLKLQEMKLISNWPLFGVILLSWGIAPL